MKLNHYIAQAGIASRRKAVDIIKEGNVTVNGVVAKNPGIEIQESDSVKVYGKLIKPEVKKVYVLLNKPAGYVSSVKDEKGRKTVMDLVSKKFKQRIYPVGRLDYTTTGLLLLTNDGDLAYKLSHPSSNVKKYYHVALDRPIPESVLERIKKGVNLSDGKVVIDRISYWSNKKKNQLMLVLHSGKYRIVKRLFAYLGYTVISLDRFRYASLTKKGLDKGEFRVLSQSEIKSLKMGNG